MNDIIYGSISRRLLLAGTGGALLSACSTGDERSAPQATSGADTWESDGTSDINGDDFALTRYFNDPSVTAGLNRRLALGVADIDGKLRVEAPDELRAELLDEQDERIVEVGGRRRTELRDRIPAIA